jgi:hypothetical protein
VDGAHEGRAQGGPLRLLRPGISPEVACIVAYADLTGAPLDPYDFNDSAVICRAELLVLDGVPIGIAIEAARLLPGRDTESGRIAF